MFGYGSENGFRLHHDDHHKLGVTKLNSLTRHVRYMYHQFNVQQFYLLPTQRIYVFCVGLRVNSNYIHMQH
jgi:superoxide dismutase